MVSANSVLDFLTYVGLIYIGLQLEINEDSILGSLYIGMLTVTDVDNVIGLRAQISFIVGAPSSNVTWFFISPIIIDLIYSKNSIQTKFKKTEWRRTSCD